MDVNKTMQTIVDVVYFDTNKVIRETFGAAGYPVPEQHFRIRNQS